MASPNPRRWVCMLHSQRQSGIRNNLQTQLFTQPPSKHLWTVLGLCMHSPHQLTIPKHHALGLLLTCTRSRTPLTPRLYFHLCLTWTSHKKTCSHAIETNFQGPLPFLRRAQCEEADGCCSAMHNQQQHGYHPNMSTNSSWPSHAHQNIHREFHYSFGPSFYANWYPKTATDTDDKGGGSDLGSSGFQFWLILYFCI